jgi:hypothetical protein
VAPAAVVAGAVAVDVAAREAGAADRVVDEAVPVARAAEAVRVAAKDAGRAVRAVAMAVVGKAARVASCSRT